MNRITAIRVESAIDASSAALLAGAIGFAGASFGAPVDPLVIAAGAFALVFAGLRSIAGDRSGLPLARFDIAPIGEHLFDLAAEPAPAGDGLAERAGPDDAVADDILLLDDVLAQPDPDSRVVRLFDPARSPGGLHASIERLARLNSSDYDPPDASLALSEALRELRRSLS